MGDKGLTENCFSFHEDSGSLPNIHRAPWIVLYGISVITCFKVPPLTEMNQRFQYKILYLAQKILLPNQLTHLSGLLIVQSTSHSCSATVITIYINNAIVDIKNAITINNSNC
jgi:hypothetical protein